jgi:hypothetical protein
VLGYGGRDDLDGLVDSDLNDDGIAISHDDGRPTSTILGVRRKAQRTRHHSKH